MAMLSCPMTAAARRLPFSQQIAQPLSRANQLDGAQQRLAAPEREPRRVEPPLFHALHCERDGAAGADGVDAKLVAALRCAQHRLGIAHAAQ
jgi:hypothetical protein